ncbi:tetratricopeptide repeat protein [Pseudomonas oryzihabitans]|uniref:tetratricopeptide repeat protein n=2 Tax=Pseudomonas TaxID=286 RepID=UPI0011A572B1|nr:tetratricopeptide repeat protein [Pseudomonas oryzihabitans]
MTINASGITIKDLLCAEYQSLLEAGVEFRNSGNIAEAHAILNAASSLYPKEWQIWYELGVLHYDNAEFDSAIDCFERSLSLNQANWSLQETLGALYASKRSQLAFQGFVQRSSVGSYESAKTLSTLKAYSEFINDYNIDYVRAYYQKNIGSEEGFLNVDSLLALFKKSQLNQEGFAFVRLGDGEGTWGFHDPVSEFKYSSLYERNREEFWKIWFGESRAADYSSFYRTIHNLSMQLKDADVIGVPPLTWVEHEYRYASIRGCAGTFNAVRMAAELASDQVVYCSQLMHYDLGQSESFLDFLSASKHVAVISCHLEMKDFLVEKLGGPQVTLIGVPGEPSRAHLLGETSLKGKHYPEYFSQVDEFILSKDWSGVPVLVAGGILGKQYALSFKSRGGIAIDIGSQADKWMGKKTRPGF